MKKIGQLLFLIITFFSCTLNKIKNRPLNMDKSPSIPIYSFEMPLLDGKMIKLSAYKGKKILIVNTASKCGYTPQYEGLEKLSKKYKDKLVILAFPANNFGSQEPGTNIEIDNFCKKNYGVSFPVFSKISVVGEDQAPLYQWLTQKEKNGWSATPPNWNFCKYLVDEKGNLIAFYASAIKPLSNEITTAIEK